MDVFIFGTGSAAGNIEPVCESLGFRIKGYLDNDREKQGGRHGNYPIYPPGQLKAARFERIIIASSFFSEIEQQLLKLGVAAEQILVFPGYGRSNGLVEHYPAARWFHRFNTLMLPLALACNLRCAHCPRQEGRWNPTELLGFERFQEYLARFSPAQFNYLNLNGHGEPTLAANFIDYLRHANQNGWKRINFFTNGLKIAPQLWEQIVCERLIEEVVFSIESIDPQRFQSIRGYQFSRLLSSLETLQRLKGAHFPSLRIMLCYTFGKFNLKELTDVVRFAEKNSIQVLDFLPLVAFYTDEDAPPGKVCTFGNTLAADDPEVHDRLAEAQQLARELGIEVRIPEFFSPKGAVAKSPFCNEPYDLVRVEPDGSLYPCCALSFRGPLGNISQQSFAEIWLGEKYQRLLKELNRKTEQAVYCQNCNHYRGNCLQLGWTADPKTGQLTW